VALATRRRPDGVAVTSSSEAGKPVRVDLLQREEEEEEEERGKKRRRRRMRRRRGVE